MTKEEKDLLLKDLCARLPYGVIVSCAEGTIMGVHWNKVKLDASLFFEFQNNDALSNVKPYLRPMSSMTEEEKKIQKDYVYHFSKNSLPDYEDDFVFENEVHEYLDWLNAHHFDYRGLIERGLAIEAPEDMYKTE